MKVIIFREKALYRKGISPLSVEAKGGKRASAVDTLIGQATSVKKLREIHLEP